MRRIYRREKQQLVFGAVVGGAGVLAVLFFLILYLPARSEYRAVAESIARFESESLIREQTVERLRATASQLEGARSERVRFLTERLIPRDQGFSAMIPDLERLAQVSGVDRTRATYSIDEEPEFGLHAVAISMPFRDSYAGLARFIEELEDADTFFILDSIALRRSQTDQAGDLDLTLNLSTFFAEKP